jgi:hypothetical protein
LFLSVTRVINIAQRNSQHCLGCAFSSLQSGYDKWNEDACADSMIERNVFQPIFVKCTIHSVSLVSNFIGIAKVSFAVSFRASHLPFLLFTSAHSSFCCS